MENELRWTRCVSTCERGTVPYGEYASFVVDMKKDAGAVVGIYGIESVRDV